MLFSGVCLEACEVVEEAQCLGVEFSGGRGDDRHETVGKSNKKRETDTFNDKQSQTAERKTGDGRGPGDHSSEAGEQLSPRPTPLTGQKKILLASLSF